MFEFLAILCSWVPAVVATPDPSGDAMPVPKERPQPGRRFGLKGNERPPRVSAPLTGKSRELRDAAVLQIAMVRWFPIWMFLMGRPVCGARTSCTQAHGVGQRT